MKLGQELMNSAVLQVAQWAQSWVDNETGIPEARSEDMTDQEKAALLLIEIMLKAKYA